MQEEPKVETEMTPSVIPAGRDGDAWRLKAVVDAPRARGEVGVDVVARASRAAGEVRGGGGVEGLYLQPAGGK